MIPLLLKLATVLYGGSLPVLFLTEKRRGIAWLFLAPALLANGAAVILRYRQAWPMLPMHLGAMALPLCLGLLAGLLLLGGGHNPHEYRVRAWMLVLAVLSSAAAVCFPKDFYLPFLKSRILFAHFFLLFGVAGKGCFLAGAGWAASGLWRTGEPGAENGGGSPLNRSLRWTVWGFAFWTLSMFSGELWSYSGWGTPVVWDDAAITTTMATWFFYICLLHLHLTGSWSARGRAVYAASGVLVVGVLNCMPDLGPFRRPF
ncbi:MAG: cytochrome c biogenesis protein CcsA [Pseudomonadota bacterium]